VDILDELFIILANFLAKYIEQSIKQKVVNFVIYYKNKRSKKIRYRNRNYREIKYKHNNIKYIKFEY